MSRMLDNLRRATDRRPKDESAIADLPSRPLPAGRLQDAGLIRHDATAVARHPFVRTGIFAWALVGIVAALAIAGVVLGQLTMLVVPLILALFPAVLLAPAAGVLRRRGVPAALAALLSIFGAIALAAAVVGLLVPAVVGELPGLIESARQGLIQFQAYVDRAPIGLDPAQVEEQLAGARDRVVNFVDQGASAAIISAAEGVVGLLLALVALFFYLKDGTRIAAWLRGLLPQRLQHDATEIGVRTWTTLGSYFRGQMLVALVDATLIGVGLAALRVPLVLPLAALVFLGGLFPIVGAFVSGGFAVLVALADRGPFIALGVLAVVLIVQQVEGHVLAPVVLGRATALHPLAVIVCLTAGGLLLGVLGAFLAVPVAASIARSIAYLRSDDRAVTGPPASNFVPPNTSGPTTTTITGM